jgi:hypothetical protein
MWDALSYGLNGFGVLAWLWAALSVLGPKFTSNFRVTPNAMSLGALKLLSHRSVICLLLIGAAHLPLSVLRLLNPYDYTPVGILLAAILLGLMILLAIGPKGFEMPLGHGLSMTLNRAPRMGVALSKYVLSFHVKKNFVEEHRQIIDLIADSVCRVKAAGGEYDLVLKSWVFARSGRGTEGVKQVRRRMRTIRRTVRVYLPILLIVCFFWGFAASKGGSSKWLEVGFWVFNGGLGLAVLMIVLVLFSARKLMQAICIEPSRSSPTLLARELAQELDGKTPGYRQLFIAQRPIPMVNLFSFSLLHRKVIKKFGGAEAGIVLVRY